jgi:hypothetical protein
MVDTSSVAAFGDMLLAQRGAFVPPAQTEAVVLSS